MYQKKINTGTGFDSYKDQSPALFIQLLKASFHFVKGRLRKHTENKYPH